MRRSNDIFYAPVHQLRSQASKFQDFLSKYNVIGMSIGVLVGGAVQKAITALVSDIIMPLLGVVDATGDWRKYTWAHGNMKLGVGNFLGTLLDFLIVTMVVYLVVRKLAKPDPLTQTCPQCMEKIALGARRCKFCTSEME